MDQINYFNDHETRAVFTEFINILILHRLNYFVIECLVHEGIILIGFTLFDMFFLACWLQATVAFYSIVRLVPVSFGLSQGVPSTSATYWIYFIISPTWPWFPPYSIVWKVVVFAKSTCIILLKYL